MSSAGYSGTPLSKKLGISNESKLMLIHSPDNYWELLQNDYSDQFCCNNETPDIIHLFVKNNAEFEKQMIAIQKYCRLNPAIVIWVSWYKKSAKIPTDVTEDSIRNFALKNDLVDVKVCAVSEIWSGLKLVVPLAKRK
jgi:hypothetical protein